MGFRNLTLLILPSLPYNYFVTFNYLQLPYCEIFTAAFLSFKRFCAQLWKSFNDEINTSILSSKHGILAFQTNIVIPMKIVYNYEMIKEKFGILHIDIRRSILQICSWTNNYSSSFISKTRKITRIKLPFVRVNGYL